ncbi:unnamed protein product [Schistosoma curassoni]|uniref:Uncharacterized protein n=1 Tax=Schistosoma curassoni TaxID=6186 RepID=A0A183L403_9TREM|nr:unnamed protein product [Schistosoma curassoni]
MINEVKSPTSSNLEVTPLRNIQLIQTPRVIESSNQKTESFKSNSTNNNNNSTTMSINKPNLPAFISQSSMNDCKRHISVPSSSFNSTTNTTTINNSINNTSATKTGITIKRQLSEAVISSE